MQRDETVLAVGRTVATLVSQQKLMSRKVGRRRIIPVIALEAFVRRDPVDSTRSKSAVEAESRSKE